MDRSAIMKEFEEPLTPILNYLAVQQQPEKADAIFVFGSLKLPAVWSQAAHLYREGFAPKILVTGGIGKKNEAERSLFQLEDRSESDFVKEQLLALGVSSEAVVTEGVSTNTLENILFGIIKLKESGIDSRKLILVAKPFHMRRCLATFQKQFPDIQYVCCPPPLSYRETLDRPERDFAERILGEFERLERYAIKGDIQKQPVPENVSRMIEELKKVIESPVS